MATIRTLALVFALTSLSCSGWRYLEGQPPCPEPVKAAALQAVASLELKQYRLPKLTVELRCPTTLGLVRVRLLHRGQYLRVGAGWLPGASHLEITAALRTALMRAQEEMKR